MECRLYFAFSAISDVRQALVLISIIAIITMVDSQFISIFYRTSLGAPDDFHMALFVLFVSLALVANTILLNLVKKTDRQQRTFRRLALNAAYTTLLENYRKMLYKQCLRSSNSSYV